MFYRKILSYNLIVGSYDKIQHVIILDLDLVQFYLNISSMVNREMNVNKWIQS